MQDLLKGLNTGQRGSYGEFLFCYIMRKEFGKEVTPIHRDRTDHAYGTERFDVKLHTCRETTPRIIKDGTVKKGITPMIIDLFTDEFILHDNDHVLFRSDSKYAYAVREEWLKGKTHYTVGKKDVSISRNIINAFKREVAEHFSRMQVETVLLARTCQNIFGNVSPHNLLPYYGSKKNLQYLPQDDRLRIFLDYLDDKAPLIDKANCRVMAYFEKDRDVFPRLPREHFNYEKIDLNLVKRSGKFKKYLFDSPQDLYENWERLK